MILTPASGELMVCCDESVLLTTSFTGWPTRTLKLVVL